MITKTLFFIYILISSNLLYALDLLLVGKGMLQYSIFKFNIYEVSYFKGETSEVLQLDYKTDVAKKYSERGWLIGLDHVLKNNPDYQNKIQWILDNSRDVSSGDTVVIKRSGTLVEFFKNALLYASIDNKDIASIIFDPWLGDFPVDKNLKNKLLGYK